MSEFAETYFKPRVKDFVSTVLLIDDQLTYSSQVTQPVSLAAPVVGMHSDASVQDDCIQRNVQIEELIAAFSAESLLVTPINPRMLNASNREICIDILVKLAKKSDVVILDWEMKIEFSQGNSIVANELANELLKKLDEDNKYRLVFIYTADSERNVKGNISTSPQNIDVKIYGKAEATASNARTYPQLAQQICVDYLEKKRGLLGAALMGSLTALRKSTFDMLSSLKEEYDEALLYHRILLTEPDKITDFCNDLIEDEILGHLCNETNTDLFSAEAFEKYLRNKQKKIGCRNSSCELTEQQIRKKISNYDELKENLGKGFVLKVVKSEEDFSELDENSEKIILKNGCAMLHPEISNNKEILKKFIPEKLNNLMKEFSCYSTISSECVHNLKLGCIVKETENNDYFLCIQPPCDSERIKKDIPQSFIFLKLLKDNCKPKFFIKKKNDEQYIGLKIINKDVATFSFIGDDQGVVSICSESQCFETGGEKKRNLEPVGCLKPMFAQKIANEFAANVSRVGIDQFEWLRMKGC